MASTSEERKAYYRAWYQKNKDRLREYHREWRRAKPDKTLAAKRKYKANHPARQRLHRINKWAKIKGYAVIPMTVIEFEQWYLKQDPSSCYMCGGSDGTMCIDHCHRTGKPRGILCHKCNTRLGTVEDVNFQKMAKEYLEKYG